MYKKQNESIRQSGGKRWNYYWSINTSQSFVSVLSSKTGIPALDLVVSQRSGKHIEKQEKNVGITEILLVNSKTHYRVLESGYPKMQYLEWASCVHAILAGVLVAEWEIWL